MNWYTSHIDRERWREYLRLVIVFHASVVLGCVPSQHQRALRLACAEQMKQVLYSTHEFVKLNGDLPRDPDGKVSVTGLVSDGALDPEIAKCTHGGLFIMNPRLEVANMLDPERAKVIIFLVHDHESLHNGNLAIFARAGGGTLVHRVDPGEYKEWLQDFVAGEDSLDLPGEWVGF